MEASEKIAVVEKYVRAFAESDMSIIEDIFAEDAVVHDPVGSEPHVGIDAVMGFYRRTVPGPATLELTGPVRCAGNSAAFPFIVVAGDLRIEIIDVFEFNEAGKVAAMRAYWSM
ncbi:MAG: nuclear transport factor 2 family protein [Halieaceae bacterium]|nr:nuclear transport factor 2 family protein [Halieaceae bacterium]